jgi:hypothetical protein
MSSLGRVVRTMGTTTDALPLRMEAITQEMVVMDMSVISKIGGPQGRKTR